MEWALLGVGIWLYVRSRGSGLPTPTTPDTERETLARVIRSEIGNGTYAQKVAVAWVTRNLAAERRQTLTQMACSPCGPQVGNTRPVSTRQDATARDREVATAVLSGDVPDPTGGATHFLSPAGLGTKYAEVRARWLGWGWRPVTVVSDAKLEIWRA